MGSAFGEFIRIHQDDDTDRLLLARDRWPEIDMNAAVSTILCRRKIRTKLPTWYACTELVYPERLPAEQCSSEETAAYKAELAARLLSGECSGGNSCPGKWKIADLTGGMGVDSLAFSKIASCVLYNERNNVLAKASEHNFKILKSENIVVFNKNISVTSSDGTISPEDLLKDFAPDLIFLDPARRSEDGRKVFLLEDCSPDILALKDGLLRLSRFIMVKLSPMADITMVAERLGSSCREIHVVASGGECKELLAVMDRDWNGPYSIMVSESGNSMSFRKDDENAAHAEYAVREYLEPAEGLYLFEPGKAIMKAGCYNLICGRFGVVKAGRETHLYFTRNRDMLPELSGFGKVYAVLKTMPFSSSCIRSLKGCGITDVTVRGLPLSSEELRKRISGKGAKANAADAGHLFAFRSDCAGNLAVTARRHMPDQETLR